MKILYIGSFEEPYDSEVYIAKSLEQLGCEVKKIQVDKHSIGGLQRETGQNNYDFILSGKGWPKGSISQYKDGFNKIPILKVAWFFDLIFGTSIERLLSSWPYLSADIVFTTDGGHQEEFERRGMNHLCLRQGIFQDEAYSGIPQKEKYDVVFVGTKFHLQLGWKYRELLLNFLRKTYGDRFKWFGKDDGMRNEKLNNLFASTKVVVGDSLYSPHYWSNRIYETLGRGGFLIFPQVPGLEKEFQYYKHFIPYRIGDWQGLKEKIDYYLTHDEEREKIKMVGFEYCRANHTYTHRCKELLRIVNDYKT